MGVLRGRIMKNIETLRGLISDLEALDDEDGRAFLGEMRKMESLFGRATEGHPFTEELRLHLRNGLRGAALQIARRILADVQDVK